MATAVGGIAAINPGKGLGILSLGSSLYDVLSKLRSNPLVYPSINITYDASNPLASTIAVSLDTNGIRLRFDGSDQRLRLIEILDFNKSRLSYNGGELVRADGNAPSFRSIYHKLFGPTFPGEYLPDQETYVLSYPGVAFSFPIERYRWDDKVDFVSLLSSSSASPAVSMAIYAGSSWAEARNELFTRQVTTPRSPLVNANSARLSTANDEIELVRIHSESRIELVRRHNTPFFITLNSTTAQDLLAELGPPSSIYRKNDHRLSIHRTSSGVGQRTEHHYTSDYTDDTSEDQQTDGDDEEEDDGTDARGVSDSSDYFYNYFNHGFDVFISTSSSSSSATGHLATKLILHGNIPGSYDFQRYRRARWTLEYLDTPSYKDPLTSEMTFDDIAGRLREKWGVAPKPMLLDRASDSPSSSIELLGGFEDGDSQLKSNGDTFSNTELYGFPNLIFEVLKNRAVCTLTVF
ncbi:hypothetical protein TWF730_005530 [Orbilia blumenaviensis]|uniref:Uncharacterized protein n=1 Tax=Orbilia blumenaviensis TaxID=1796055 RepID=A0AAV9VIN2_9PEZI